MEVGVSQRTTSFTMMLCGLTIAAGLVACERREGTGGAGSTAAGATGSAVAAAVHLPGDLTSPIDDMTEGQLWTATTALVTLPEAAAQERKCRNGKCWGMIEAVANQKPGPGSVNSNGTVVAVLKNFGDSQTGGADRGAEDKYGTEMNPDKRYLLVARPNGSGGWRWAVRVAIKDGTRKPADSTAWGDWAVCKETQESDNTHPKGKSAFYKCKDIKPGTGTLASVFFVRNNIDAPGWLDCEQGCCTAGQ